MTISKLRAWDKISKKMFPVMMVDFGQSYVMIEEINGLWCERDFDEVELMQSIDLVDWEGVEVYEGDIVHAYGEDTYLIGVIEYFDNAYCIKTKNGIYNLLWTNAEQYEIIGNIYENPEFLEEE